MSAVATLQLDLTGGPETVTLEKGVPLLQPAAQTTVSFEDVAVVAGGQYEVTATLVGIEADLDPTDNEIADALTVSEGGASGSPAGTIRGPLIAPRLLRESPDLIRDSLRRRGSTIDLDALIALEASVRAKGPQAVGRRA